MKKMVILALYMVALKVLDFIDNLKIDNLKKDNSDEQNG
jgi:hypothetical protein